MSYFEGSFDNSCEDSFYFFFLFISEPHAGSPPISKFIKSLILWIFLIPLEVTYLRDSSGDITDSKRN